MARPRTSTTALVRSFHDAKVPVYLVDETGQLIFLNESCAQWLGVAIDELLGKRCQYVTDLGLTESSVYDRLSPPPTAFLGQACTLQITPLPHASQRPVSKTGNRDSAAVATGHDGADAMPAVPVPTSRDVLFLPISRPGGAAFHVLAIATSVRTTTGLDIQQASSSEHLLLHEQLQRLRMELSRTRKLSHFVGDSPAIVRARSQATIAQQCDAAVLITGPAGVGKEHLARIIHYERAKSNRFLVPLRWAVLDVELLESTLEGVRHDLAEESDPVELSLLLLDIDQLATEAQQALVQVLQTFEYPARTLATSERNLLQLAAAGQFHVGLAHALSVISIELPS
ncbi:MAG: sigma 54-interacting transcriptional regulator, partial [Planctomycetales bacterium]|nr:sigma 54-interacting transcriptional regulator [Planctomycetales bacterium]